MTKGELIESIAKKTDLNKRQSGETLNVIIEEITKSLSKGKDVVLPGFGKFLISNRKARKGRNPKTGAEIKIPKMKVPRFKAGKSLKEAVR
jgi:DNA-binding protein HU-beta